MACNEILRAITDVTPSNCFSCCALRCIDDMCQQGYCNLLHEKIPEPMAGRLEGCPLVLLDKNLINDLIEILASTQSKGE